LEKTFPSPDPVQIVDLLRTRIFALTVQELELDPQTCPTPWGVMMEIGYEEEAVTLVVLADGSVSIYLRSGKGRIGCGLNAEVRTAGMRMLRLAREPAASELAQRPYPPPSDGQVCFYFHTLAGLRSINAPRAPLDDGVIELAELYYAGHAVIDMIELTGAGQLITDAIEDAAASVRSATSAQPTESKRCRILPYVGSVARRSRR
jgi:hypothetical protein